MIPLPKPRGFWDYGLFALVLTGGLMFLFWLEASNAASWADAALAFVLAVLFVFAVRRGERARWTVEPTWHAHLLIALGLFGLVFGAMYADAYLLHRTDITSTRFRRDVVLAVVFTAWVLWRLRKQRPLNS